MLLFLAFIRLVVLIYSPKFRGKKVCHWNWSHIHTRSLSVGLFWSHHNNIVCVASSSSTTASFIQIIVKQAIGPVLNRKTKHKNAWNSVLICNSAHIQSEYICAQGKCVCKHTQYTALLQRDRWIDVECEIWVRYATKWIKYTNQTNRDDYCVRITAIQFHAYQSRCLYLCSLDEDDVFAVALHRTGRIERKERKRGRVRESEKIKRSELWTRWLYWTKWMHFFDIGLPWPNTKLKNQFKRNEYIWNSCVCRVPVHCCFIFSFPSVPFRSIPYYFLIVSCQHPQIRG